MQSSKKLLKSTSKTRSSAKPWNRAIRVVHVGCGGMAGAWLNPARDMPGYKLVGLVDINPAAAEEYKAKLELADAEVGADLQQMLSTQKPDVVFNCTVPQAHYPVTMAALAAGCHVLTEKPLANSMAEALKMVKAAEKKNLLFAVLQNFRYQASIRHIQKLIKKGVIGRISALHADFQIGAHFGGFREEMAHVLLHDMSIHTFDMARFLSGTSPQAVYCHEFNPAESWFRHGAAAHAIFEMSDGIVFNYRGSWCAQGTPGSWNSAWRIQGSKGAILWDGGEEVCIETVSGKAGFFRDVASKSETPLQKTGTLTGHAAILKEFLTCLQKGGVPETHAADNIHSLAMVFKAIESANKKRRILF